MKVITLLNEKGGVGKTTLSTHLAAGLAIRGNRVLLIDADAQAHSTLHLGKAERGGLFNLLIDGNEWGTETFEVPPSVYAGDYGADGQLYLMPSNIKNRLIPMATDGLELLHERLEEIETLVDVVVIDTSPDASMLHTLIYVASDYVLYPSQPEMFSSDGLLKSMRRVPKINQMRENMGLGKCTILGVQMTMTEMQTAAHQHVIKMAKQQYGNYVWNPIAKRTIWRESQLVRKTLFAYDPSHQATDEVWGMVNKVRRKLGA
ncbi:MAG TPA: ParA family protein [Elainellaceae cyanobacterium]